MFILPVRAPFLHHITSLPYPLVRRRLKVQGTSLHHFVLRCLQIAIDSTAGSLSLTSAIIRSALLLWCS